MNFKYKNYDINIKDNNITYKFKNNKEESFSVGFLNSVITKSDNAQTYFNGLNLEVLRYIKFYLLPIYYRNLGQSYYVDYSSSQNKNVIRPFIVPVF